MDRKGIALLIFALILALGAGGSIYLYLKGVPTIQAKEAETVPIVVARKDMTFGTTLGNEHLRVVQFPRGAVPTGSYASIDSVLEQTTKVFVVEGEPVLASKLSAIGGGLSVRIPSHLRAMSLKVNDVTGVSGFVLPGDRVDVLITVDNAAGAGIAVTKTILQGVEVLAAGSKTETKGSHHITVQTATLLVTPEGAEQLALGVSQGKVHLALRNPVDLEVVAATNTNTRSVMGIQKTRKAKTRRRTTKRKPTVKTTKKAPEPIEFTVIRDGRIVRQESPTKTDTN